MNAPMNTISAQQIKRRGISAVDDLIDQGPVHVTVRNKPGYVVVSETQYVDLLDELRRLKHQLTVTGFLTSPEPANAGHQSTYSSSADLMAGLYRSDGDDALETPNSSTAPPRR